MGAGVTASSTSADRVVGGEGLAVDELLEEWHDYGVSTKDWSPRHRLETRRVIDVHLIPALGNSSIVDLTITHVERLMDDMRHEGVSAFTVRRTRTAMITALNFAIRRRYLEPGQNAAQYTEPPKLDRKPPTYLQPDDLPRFLKAVESDRLSALYITSMALALRPGEAFGLRWEDVDLDAGALEIRRTLQYSEGEFVERPPKASSYRRIALPDQLVEVLKEHRRRQVQERLSAPEWTDSGLVFTNLRGGPVLPTYAYARLRKLLDRAGLPRLSLYQLRHSGATLALSMGVPLEQVRDLLGHASISMTTTYAQLLEGTKRDTAMKIGKAFEDASAS